MTVHVVHRRDGAERRLVSRGEYVTDLGSRVGGLVRLAASGDHALVFEFDSVGDHRASTVLTPLALDVVWTTGGRVTRVARLPKWTGTARGTGDAVFEFSRDVADDVEAGDELFVRQSHSSRSTE
ncbi:DUF192 domain-containing protein [Haladaptatus sp. T7]|uniref:DUF192 domain-containing protein n=1 Tax=Haladaptatus sp. T7 TaxID=2029368 RepID=UPI0021A259A5|nr:DUF192 domain-containing protein [Haladaptatus sp. T7]GKZ16122.1 hypothetical protein HAL_40030 [Haladaptatus sp. T7]